jgi:hypothetical protein
VLCFGYLFFTTTLMMKGKTLKTGRKAITVATFDQLLTLIF